MNYKVLGIIVVIIIVGIGIYAYARHAQAPVVSTSTTTPESTTGTDAGTTGTKTGTQGGVTGATPASKDAMIKSLMSGIVMNAAAYKNAHTMSYGAEIHNSCANAVSGSTVFSSPSVRAALVSVISTGSKQQVCEIYDGGSSFAVSVETVSNPSQWYCVDSTGFNGKTTGNTLSTTNKGC